MVGVEEAVRSWKAGALAVQGRGGHCDLARESPGDCA